MGPVATKLVARFASKHGAEPGARRAAYGLLGGYASILVNTFLALVKVVLGLLTGSIGIMADAVHTFSDCLTSAVLIGGAYVSRKPPDEEHPFGHGRAESVATMIIAVLLGVAGVEFGKVGVERLISPTDISVSWGVVLVLVLTIIVKEWLSRFTRELAVASGNTSLEADFWHHRSDAISTVLVVIGVVAGHFGWPQVDALAAIGVAIFLIVVAYTVARDAFNPLVGEAPTATEVRDVKEMALSVEGVRGVHDVVIHRYGELRFVSLHVETADDLPVLALHTITHEVERRLAAAVHGAVCVHPDPVNCSHPHYATLEELMGSLVEGDEELESFHDLRIVGDEGQMYVIVEVKPNPGVTNTAAALERLAQGLQRVFPGAELVVEVEPIHSC